MHLGFRMCEISHIKIVKILILWVLRYIFGKIFFSFKALNLNWFQLHSYSCILGTKLYFNDSIYHQALDRGVSMNFSYHAFDILIVNID